MRAKSHRRLALSLAGLLSCSAALVFPASAQSPSDTVLLPQCAEQDAQVNGPPTTDVNAQAGNGRITVGLSSAGNITVFRYPNPSYYNQVKYFTTGADPSTGQADGELPNEGSFAGLLYAVKSGATASTTMQWLKQPDLANSGWNVSQAYAADDTPVVITTYQSPAPLGLTVTITDLANAAPLSDPSAPATFIRDIEVQLAPGSPVIPSDVNLVYYEHFDAFGSRFRYFPVEDSCFQQFDDSQIGNYDSAADAIVQSWQGIDQASDKPSSVAFAFGFDRSSSSHQVGEDGYDPAAPPLASADSSLTDGYTEMSDAPNQLSNSNTATGQVTGTLVTPLDLSTSRSDSVRMVIGAGATPTQAVAALQSERESSLSSEEGAVNSYWSSWLQDAPMPSVPSSSPEAPEASRIMSVAKRSLITMRLAVDPDTGAIVASADTQGPYGEDWVRDGSFIDEALDEAGYEDLATGHALFEASAQTSATNPDVLRPAGNWPMNAYGDGIPGGPIPYEIDETGFGAWTLYRQSTFLTGSAASQYLLQVYPAIARAADWLTTCKDPVDGLQCYANEDDNITPSQTLHGAGPDLLGLDSAVAAAKALVAAYPTSPSVTLWQAQATLWQGRATQLDDAILALYNADGTADHLFAESSPKETDVATAVGAPSPVPTSYQVFTDGGWLLWPVQLNAPASEMQSEAAAVLSDDMGSLGDTTPGYTGSYEGKGLLGVCKWLPGSGLSSSAAAFDLGKIQQGVGMLAASSTIPAVGRGFTTDTGLFAEAWENYDIDGSTQVIPLNDEPHVWEHALYYMTALCAFPPSS